MQPPPATMLASVPWSIDRRKLVRWLWVLTAFFGAASLAVQVVHYFYGHEIIFGLVRTFDVDSEPSFPNFFSVCLLLFAAVLLKLIATNRQAAAASHARHWFWLAVGFFYMACDEVVGIHDLLIRPMNLLFGPFHGIFFISWVVVGLCAVIPIAALYLQFLRRLPGKTGVAFAIAGLIYVGGAVGMEMVSGRYMEDHPLDFTLAIMNVIEECMEMSGAILFIDALLRYCAAERIVVSLVTTEYDRSATASASAASPPPCRSASEFPSW